MYNFRQSEFPFDSHYFIKIFFKEEMQKSSRMSLQCQVTMVILMVCFAYANFLFICAFYTPVDGELYLLLAWLMF